MDGEKTFEQVIMLSKLSLEITLLQNEIINDLVSKLKKYEDVTEYEEFLSLLNGGEQNKEDKNSDENNKED